MPADHERADYGVRFAGPAARAARQRPAEIDPFGAMLAASPQTEVGGQNGGDARPTGREYAKQAAVVSRAISRAEDAEPTWWSWYGSPMKAAVHTRYGPPDVVRISEVEKPTAKNNEPLVRVTPRL
jgi:hypothetical protein